MLSTSFLAKSVKWPPDFAASIASDFPIPLDAPVI